MVVLTLAVICRDEDDRIERCLTSVPFASEHLVLDSGSTDKTLERCLAFGARVVQTDWPGFVEQRNRALALAREPWVLFLDADERLSPQLVEELQCFIGTNPDVAGGSFPRCSRWQGAWIRHGRWYPDRKVRLVRRGYGSWSGAGAHEVLSVDGVSHAFAMDILHEPYRNIGEHWSAIDRYTRLQASELAKNGARGVTARMLLGPPLHFIRALVLERGILDGWRGVGLATLGAANVAMKWSRTRSLQR